MVTTLVNMVDVNVTTQNKTNEEQVFKYRKPRKNKFAIDWEIEEKLKRSMVEPIQQMQVINLPLDLPIPSTKEWMISWARMPNSTEPANLIELQEVPFTSPNKTIFVEEIFQDINKQMLEISYTMNLG
jgi:hypothetical protein